MDAHARFANILTALGHSFETRGFPATNSMMDGARVAHAGGPAALLVLMILIPPLIMNAMGLLLDWGIWREFGEYALIG